MYVNGCDPVVNVQSLIAFQLAPRRLQLEESWAGREVMRIIIRRSEAHRVRQILAVGGPQVIRRYEDVSVGTWVDNLVADEPELDRALGDGVFGDFENDSDLFE